jgi:hypothetical protein
MSDPRQVPQPEQRVRDFLAAYVHWWGDATIESVPVRGDVPDVDLNPSDLRDVLNELDSWRTAAEKAGVSS